MLITYFTALDCRVVKFFTFGGSGGILSLNSWSETHLVCRQEKE